MRYFLLLFAFITLSCSPKKSEDTNAMHDAVMQPPVETLTDQPDSSGFKFTSRILSILEDSKGNFWFGSYEGVCRYDGKIFTYYPKSDGRAMNIRTLQEDKNGNIWFETRDGISCVDGSKMTIYNRDSLKSKNREQFKKSSDRDWKKDTNDLWFDGGNGMFRYDGENFNYLKFPVPDEADSSRTLGAVSAIIQGKDKLWISGAGTVLGYDGTSFTHIPSKGLDMHVRDIYEDSHGNLWIANNLTNGGYCGIMRYDGNSLIHFSNQTEAIKSGQLKGVKVQPGSLLRVFCIAEDNEGNMWFGTTNYGVWRFDGKSFINYTLKDGLTCMDVFDIYKDKKGDLWFGMENGTVCKFNGKTFDKIY
jgi:ligand-binding sensor domain-containing protein